MKYTAIFLYVLVEIIFLNSVQAQQNNALMRAQYMLRQLTTEKNALHDENIRLKKEVELLKSEIGQSKKGNKNLSSMVSRLKKKGRELATILAGRNQDMQTLNQEKEHLLEFNQQYQNKLNLCITNNQKLANVNFELLQKYKNKGIWKAIKNSEPIIKLSRVDVENLVQDFQYQIEDLQFKAETLSVVNKLSLSESDVP